MNIFSNLGITELLIILVLALVVIGPERLPEFGRKLGKTLRDLRRAYDNLTRDLGPELASIQQSTQELRESVEAVVSIPQDVVKTVVKAADLDETVGELRQTAQEMGQIGTSLSTAGKAITDPIGAAASAARSALHPGALADATKPKGVAEAEVDAGAERKPEPEPAQADSTAEPDSNAAVDEVAAESEAAQGESRVEPGTDNVEGSLEEPAHA